MILLFALIVTVLWVSLRKPGGLIAYPTVFAGALLFWLMPQLYAVRMDSPHMEAISTPFMVMTGLCLLAAAAGWWLARPGTFEPGRARFDLSHYTGIIPVTIGLTVVSAVLAVLLEGARVEMEGVQQWTGTATIYAFLAQLRIVPFALSLLLFMKRRNSVTIGLLLANAAITLPVALIYMRRSEMVDIAVVSLGVYWFARRKSPRLVLVLAMIVPIFAATFAIGELRANATEIYQTTGDRPWITNPTLWARFDIGSVVQRNVERAVDILNGIYAVAYGERTGEATLGARTWNAMVFQFVPAQIVGPDIKNSLMIGDRNYVVSGVQSLFGHRYQTGTTSTGIGSAFLEFQYFGCLIFALIGYIMGRMYRRANSGAVWAQILYLVFLPITLISMTHGHELFFTNLPLFLGIAGLGSWLSRYKVHYRHPKHRGQLGRVRA